ncbi:PD-(D/E)XK motif protein [Spiroplasma gladiatoris]|uniref:PD-(D/E)XK motif protein n=1 Tax=Spiroplasma gladiatoris TaxID=2143 RepID=A0A4V1AQA4_9MOLU|nr:hypothetical protein [Spiroplasma gladiatoris]QBQ07809.1 PD-(D/E)XK motif protein [Spiroplasma gladiatoris]
MENLKIIEEQNGFVWGMIKETNQYFILKKIINHTLLPKNIKHLNKPNFSYYPSLNGLSELSKEDEKTIGFPKLELLLEINNEEFDAEIIFLVKNCPEKMAKMVFEIFYHQAVEESIYDIVCELENIFGLVWKLNKKVQIGMIGELLVMQKNEMYLQKLLDSYHFENLNEKKMTSKTDFEIINNDKVINIEVKTTTSQDGLFTLKNDQVNKNINDYYAAVSIKIIKKGGKTLIDLIEWYLSLPQLANEAKDILEDIKKSHEPRTLIKFDNTDVVIKFIETKNIPYIKEYSNLITDINYKINLFSFEEVKLEDIFS